MCVCAFFSASVAVAGRRSKSEAGVGGHEAREAECRGGEGQDYAGCAAISLRALAAAGAADSLLWVAVLRHQCSECGAVHRSSSSLRSIDQSL